MTHNIIQTLLCRVKLKSKNSEGVEAYCCPILVIADIIIHAIDIKWLYKHEDKSVLKEVQHIIKHTNMNQLLEGRANTQV